MKVDTVVTLDDGKKYLLLLQDELMEDEYFLSVLLDEMNEPTNEYVILKQIVNEDGVYTQKIKNPIILSQLLEDYNVKYKSEYDK